MTRSLFDFHKQRCMFAITDRDTVMVAPNYISASHREWLEDLGYDSWVRGFWWPKTNDLYFYGGDNYNFAGYMVMRKNYRQLIAKMGLLPVDHVYGGMIPGIPGELWAYKKDFTELMRLVEERG